MPETARILGLNVPQALLALPPQVIDLVFFFWLRRIAAATRHYRGA